MAVVLVAIGGIVALSFDRLAPAGALGGAGASAASPSATDAADENASEDPFASGDLGLPSDNPSDAPSESDTPSPSPASPVLAAEMPREVSGTPLSVETDLGSEILGKDPSSRSFSAAVGTLGVSPDRLEIGYAYDEAGSLALTVLGFRIPGVTAAKLRPLVLESWLSTTAPGVKSTAVTLSGTPATRVSYGDNGSDEYVFTHGDAVFIIETTDVNLATAVVKAMPAAPEASSPAAS
jgi:hypothetical protein